MATTKKAALKKTDIVKVTSENGLEYTIDQDVLDDMELFEDLMTIEDPEATAVEKTRATNRVFDCLIGAEQKAKLDAFLKERDGRVRFSEYQKEIASVFSGLKTAKKN